MFGLVVLKKYSCAKETLKDLHRRRKRESGPPIPKFLKTLPQIHPKLL